MKRVPFSYSTFTDTQKKAYNKAKREKTTVSTVIHTYLLEYTAGEPDPAEQPPGPASATNKADPAAGNQPENAPVVETEGIRSENTSDGGESLQPPLTPETEAIRVDPEPIAQPENNTAGEPVEAAHSENNTNENDPLTEGKPVPPAKKKSAVVKPAKKASSAAVKKSPPQKTLKKVTPKQGVAAKKKNQGSKAKKSKAKS